MQHTVAINCGVNTWLYGIRHIPLRFEKYAVSRMRMPHMRDCTIPVFTLIVKLITFGRHGVGVPANQGENYGGGVTGKVF